jgi:hypothetical protein
MDRQLIGEEDTFLWLLRGELKEETESEKIIAAQDQALQTIKHNKSCKQKQQMQTVSTI